MKIFRKALPADLDQVAAIYDKIHQEEAAGRASIGWLKDVYPVRATAEAALLRDDLFVCQMDGKVVGAAILNHKQDECYLEGNWSYAYDEEEILVMHTLVIDPSCAGHGLGKSFVEFYETYAKERGIKALRIDTQVKNSRARAMYRKCGFEEVGVVPCIFNGIPDVKLVLIEKGI